MNEVTYCITEQHSTARLVLEQQKWALKQSVNKHKTQTSTIHQTIGSG